MISTKSHLSTFGKIAIVLAILLTITRTQTTPI